MDLYWSGLRIDNVDTGILLWEVEGSEMVWEVEGSQKSETRRSEVSREWQKGRGKEGEQQLRIDWAV